MICPTCRTRRYFTVQRVEGRDAAVLYCPTCKVGETSRDGTVRRIANEVRDYEQQMAFRARVSERLREAR